MSSEQRWRINIRNIAATVRVGIHAHEKEPQRVFINATVEGIYPAKPLNIEQCFNYDHVHSLVTQEWPKRPHTALLETYVAELLEHVFRIDKRVVYAKASVCKPDIFSDTDSVGVEAEWTRADFERLIK